MICDKCIHKEVCKLYDPKSKLVGCIFFQPVHKKGKWVNDKNDMAICSECGYYTPFDHAIDDYEYGNFCPNCGARMEDTDK